MRKQLKTLLFIAGLLGITGNAETIHFGGDSAVRTAGWLDLAGESGVNNVQPISYTDANGITFTVTATANSGQNVTVQNVGLSVKGGSSDTRIDGSESLGLTLSVSGGNLASLSASFLVGSLGMEEGFDVTDGTSSVVIAELADDLVEYGPGKELDGLAPLTESNVSTWSIQFKVNGGYPATKGLLSALILDYTLTQSVQYPLYAEAAQLYSNAAPYDLSQETYTFSNLWSTPAQEDLNFLPGSYHSPVVSRGDDTFVLFVDTEHRMKIAHLTNDVFKEEAFIDNTLYQPDEFYDGNGGNEGYHTVKFEDGHHACSLGVDEDGYLHLVGDMHNYPRWSTDHLPLRYHNKNIMYWRSDNPLDVSSFSFKGDQTGECPPGYGFTYPFFFNDLNGKLHMTSRTHQWTNNSTRCATYSRYDADTGLWSIIGGLDPADPDSEPRTFYDDGREYDAGNLNNKYSKTCPHGVFDRNNHMHLVTPLLSNPTLNPWGMGSGQHFVDTIVYAQSTNGTDYAKADGSSITLPSTIDLTTNQADIIYNAPTDRYLSVLGNMAVDYQNNPYTVVRQKSYDPNDNNADNQSIVLGWDGNAWTNYGEIVAATTDFRLVHDPAGVMSYIPDSLDRFYRFWHPSETPEQINLPAAWPYIKTIDYEYLKKTGNILGLSKIGGQLTVVKVEINDRPGMTLIDPPEEAPANHAPVITAPATANGYDLSVEATDADGDPLIYTWEKTYGPGDASFSVNGTAASSNTTVSVTELGTYEFKVVVSDGTDPRTSTCYLLATGPGIPATTFQIGGLSGEFDARWDSMSVTGSTGTYSFADTEDPNLVFTITAVALNGDALALTKSFLGVDSTARQTDPKTGRINLDEAIQLTVSYVDPGNSLASLELSKFGPYYGNNSGETTVFTDASANSTNIVAFDHSLYNNLIDYTFTGLDALTKYNALNWAMTVSTDDTAGLTQSGMGGFMLSYVVDVGGDNIAPYDQWAGSYYPAIHAKDGYGDDAEPGGGDGMNNLLEYALGGDPLVHDAAEKLPILGSNEEDGTNWFNYIYNRRLDAYARNLTYEVLATTNLVSGAWSNATEEAGSVVLDAEFESVTNRVSIDSQAHQFMKLDIGVGD
ncbi:BNR-4 repeat-containing protein [Pontiellaceae bacterium B12227]|nr:BNR-4 repeat-containing protein [Pontiellaceae bacterium B12227]